MAWSPGIDPGPHWWKASALTAAPTLLLQGKEEKEEFLKEILSPD